MIRLIAFTPKGLALGRSLSRELSGVLYAPERLSGQGTLPCTSLSDWCREGFEKGQDMIFVCAIGIAVRGIAPYVRDKLRDPAVVTVDEQGRFAISLLSGHMGGANRLAATVARITGGQAVISTATDLNGVFAVDVWAGDNSLIPWERERIRLISGALLQGECVGFCSDFPVGGQLPAGLTRDSARVGICVTEDLQKNPYSITLHLVPRNLVLGMGCKRGISLECLEQVVCYVLEQAGMDLHRVRAVGTIDLKKDEEGLLSLCQKHRWGLSFFTPQELNRVTGDFPPSEFVRQVTGVDNVCQRAALCLGERILLPKQGIQGVTVAVATSPVSLTFER